MSAKRLSPLELERFALGESKGVVDAEELQALRESNDEILAAHPPAAVAAEVKRRLRATEARLRSPSRVRWLVAAASALGAAVLVVSVGARRGPADDGVRLKGLAPHLVVYRDGATPERLADRAPARPHDVVQLGYVAAGRRYGAIVSLDGRGEVTLHLAPQALAETGEVRLPSAFELDDAPAFERFVFVTGDEPFDEADVLGAARGAATGGNARDAPLPLPRGLQQSSFTLEKLAP